MDEAREMASDGSDSLVTCELHCHSQANEIGLPTCIYEPSPLRIRYSFAIAAVVCYEVHKVRTVTICLPNGHFLAGGFTAPLSTGIPNYQPLALMHIHEWRIVYQLYLGDGGIT